MGDLFGGDETQTQTSKVILPGYAKKPLKQASALAMEAAEQPFTPFTGDRFAEFSPDEMAAFDLTRQLTGAGGPDLGFSQGVIQDVIGQGLGGIDPSLLQSYMDPYLEDVLATTQRSDLERFQQQKMALQQQGGAYGAGAFGGSRFGLAQAQQLKDFSQQQSQQEAGLRSQAFQQGLAGAERGLTRAGAGAIDYANLQQLQQGLGLQGAQALGGIGMQQRGLEQQGLDFQHQEFLREQAFPYEQAQFLAGIGTPIAGVTAGQQTTTETSGGGSPLGTILGLASMAMGVPGIGAALGGGMMGLGSAIGSGAMMGAGTGMAAGLGGSQIGRMALGGAQGMFGPGFQNGGLVGERVDNFLQGYQGGGVADFFKQGTLLDYIDELRARHKEFSEYTPTPTSSRLEMLLGGAGEGLGQVVRAPLSLGLAPFKAAGAATRGVEEFLTERPGVTAAQETLQQAPELYAEQQRILDSFLADTSDKDILGQLIEGGLKEKKAAGAPKSEIKSFEDILASLKGQKADPEEARRKALMDFGASLLGSKQGFFKSLGAGYGAVQEGRAESEMASLTKEKALRDMAKQQVQQRIDEQRLKAYVESIELQKLAAPSAASKRAREAKTIAESKLKQRELAIGNEMDLLLAEAKNVMPGSPDALALQTRMQQLLGREQAGTGAGGFEFLGYE